MKRTALSTAHVHRTAVLLAACALSIGGWSAGCGGSVDGDERRDSAVERDAGPVAADARADGTTAERDGGAREDAGEPDAGPGCGDGICGADEDDATCGGDCGCGSVASEGDVTPAGCSCDTGCDGRGDCCADACSAFGTCFGDVSHAWMHIYTHWSLAAGDLSSLESPLRIDVDPSGQSWFWATTFGFGTQGGYIGIQTRGESGGKVARFSIWDSTAASAPAGGTGGCRDFDGEGVGKTCWVPFEWREGVLYRLRVERLPSGWWRGSLVPDGGEPVLIGDIQGPPGGMNIQADVSAFTEYYGAFLPSCEALNTSDALFPGPTGNGGSVPASRTGNSVGPSACEGLFSESPEGPTGGRHRVN